MRHRVSVWIPGEQRGLNRPVILFQAPINPPQCHPGQHCACYFIIIDYYFLTKEAHLLIHQAHPEGVNSTVPDATFFFIHTISATITSDLHTSKVLSLFCLCLDPPTSRCHMSSASTLIVPSVSTSDHQNFKACPKTHYCETTSGCCHCGFTVRHRTQADREGRGSHGRPGGSCHPCCPSHRLTVGPSCPASLLTHR